MRRRLGSVLAAIAGGARNIVADLRVGGFFAGEFLRRDDRPENRHRGNSDHAALRQIFQERVRPDDVLVDVGCGAGRVIAVWRRMFPAHRLVGIELNLELAARVRRRFRDSDRVEIVGGDAVANLPDDGTLFYLFNPLGRAGIVRLEARLHRRALADHRVRVLYHNPKHLDVFADSGRWESAVVELQSPRGARLHPLAVVSPRDRVPGAPGSDPAAART